MNIASCLKLWGERTGSSFLEPNPSDHQFTGFEIALPVEGEFRIGVSLQEEGQRVEILESLDQVPGGKKDFLYIMVFSIFNYFLC